MSGGRVLFVGCGPGAPDLLTLRAVDALAAADIIIWSASLIDRQTVVVHARADAELVEWPPATQRAIDAIYDRALAEGLIVVRLKGGDPMLFGDVEAELAAVRERGLDWEVVPGVSAAGASAAALGWDIATTGGPLLLVDGAAPAATPAARTVIAVHGAARDARGLQRDLLGRGLASSTPCALAIEVTRRDESLVECVLGELAETVEDLGRGLLTLVLATPSRSVQETTRND